jgi:hypothetical protein
MIEELLQHYGDMFNTPADPPPFGLPALPPDPAQAGHGHGGGPSLPLRARSED